MSSGQKTMTLFITAILGLVFVILGLSIGWPLWGWPIAAALLLLIAAATYGVLRRGGSAPPSGLLPEFEQGPPVAPRLEQHVTHVALPSAVPDYDFSFSAIVRWTELAAAEDAPAINPAGLAVDAVLQRARSLTAHQQPTRSAFVQHQLNGALGTMRVDATGRVLAMAQDVSLSLPELDRERLCKLSNVRKDEDVWEHERNYERSKRTYLGDDVLKDTGSAVVWWLSRNDKEIEGAVDRIGLFARLSAAANNDAVAPPFEHLVPSPPPPYASDPNSAGAQRVPPSWEGSFRLFGDEDADEGAAKDSPESVFAWFGISPEDPEFDIFAQRLINLALAHGKTDIADEIRRRLGRDEPREDSEGATPDSDE